MPPIIHKTYLIIFEILLLLSFTNNGVQAQTNNINLYEYLSPVPGARMVMPSTCIIIRYMESLSSTTPQTLSGISVTGSKSGLHKGQLSLLENNSILSFKPFLPFDYGEKVTVELKSKFRLTSGSYNPYLKYSFRITNKKINEAALLSFLQPEPAAGPANIRIRDRYQNNYKDTLPDDFPRYLVEYNNPSDGDIFFSPMENSGYLIISDKYGTPVFYRKMTSRVLDFQKQADGNLTYIENDNRKYIVLNSKYEITDSVQMRNGYTTDFHELRVLDNGHYLLMANDPEIVGMDTVVAGGNPNAIVTGLVLQELDEHKNLIFQWRSWDHFDITDATYDINLTDNIIDYVHANAIETDYDGNILLSSRHMDEITKINRITGDIMWRWGGIYCKNNQFTFLNDSTGFSHQHCIRRLPNGNYTIFDNGNLHSPKYSRAVEYSMDEGNRTVTLVWENTNMPVSYTIAMGSTQRLSNQNTFIGWGTTPKVTEVAPDGTELFSLTLFDNTYCYRAFKYSWDQSLLTSDKDTLHFGVVPIGQSGTVSFTLTNNSSNTVEINSVFNRNSVFSLQQPLPVVISSQGTVNLSADFNPDTAGIYSDDLHLRWETNGQRIAKEIHLSGTTEPTYLNADDSQLPTGFSLSQNYPNPFNPVSTIKYSLPHSSKVKLQVFDILGNMITTPVNKQQSAGRYEVKFNGSNLSSGIYFYRMRAGSFVATRKMILLR
ncbi:MAG TPA: aryl-sulfate sulfotransferase [Ignavibacteriaceae bacterium]|nr:aryl-sulfate sulfotransferase [Ignavibacteriaceae bacterium]